MDSFPETKKCPHCGASFIGEQLYWATGKEGTKADLAGLVCDVAGNSECINELKGTKHEGQTWEKRAAFLEGLEVAMKDRLDKDK